MRGWQREQLVFGVGAFAQPGVSFEQEYLKTLLLMRLDSGNFTPDQVEWVARQLDGLGAVADARAAAGRGRGVLRRPHGLRRACGAATSRHPAAACCCLDAAPVYARIVERMRWLPEHDDDVAEARRPAAARAAAAADAARVAVRPRRDRAGAARARASAPTARCASSSACRRSRARSRRSTGCRTQARTPGVAASYDEVTQMVNPTRESGIGRAAHSRHDLDDDRPQRHRLPARSRRRRRRRRAWASSSRSRKATGGRSAVVRRMQRQQVDEITVGVEIIARRLVRVLMRSWVDAVGRRRGRAPTARSSASTCRRTRTTASRRSAA